MHPQKSYIICAIPRSGSYLLCEALTNTGLAGRPAEFFSQGLEQRLFDHWQLTKEEYQQYLAKIFGIGTTPNGVFGIKIIWLTLEECLDKLRTLPGCAHKEDAELFSTLFPDLQYIAITRRDKLRQAISYSRALQTNEWVRSKDSSVTRDHSLVFHRPTIERFLRQIEAQEQTLQQFFARHGIEPFHVVYEDLVTEYEETAKNILHYLGIPFTEPLVFGERRIVKQADEITEEWVQLYQSSQVQS